MESSKERVSTLSAVEMSLQVTLYNNKKYIMMESKFAENGIIFLCGMFFFQEITKTTSDTAKAFWTKRTGRRETRTGRRESSSISLL